MIRLIPLEIMRLYKVLPGLYRLRLWGIAMAVFVMAVIDLIGTGILLPILLLVLNDNVVLENKYLALLYNWAGFVPLCFLFVWRYWSFQSCVFACQPGCSI